MCRSNPPVVQRHYFRNNNSCNLNDKQPKQQQQQQQQQSQRLYVIKQQDRCGQTVQVVQKPIVLASALCMGLTNVTDIDNGKRQRSYDEGEEVCSTLINNNEQQHHQQQDILGVCSKRGRNELLTLKEDVVLESKITNIEKQCTDFVLEQQQNNKLKILPLLLSSVLDLSLENIMLSNDNYRSNNNQINRLRHRRNILQRLYNRQEDKLQQAFHTYGISTATPPTSLTNCNGPTTTTTSSDSSTNTKYGTTCSCYRCIKHRQLVAQRHVHFAEITRVIYHHHRNSTTTNDHDDNKNKCDTRQSSLLWYNGAEIRRNNCINRELTSLYQNMYEQQKQLVDTRTTQTVDDVNCIDDCDVDGQDHKHTTVHNVMLDSFPCTNYTYNNNDDGLNFIGLEKKIVLPLRLQILQRYLAKKHVGRVLLKQQQYRDCLAQQQQQQQQQQPVEAYNQHDHDVVSKSLYTNGNNGSNQIQQQYPQLPSELGYEQQQQQQQLERTIAEAYQNEIRTASYVSSYPCAKRAYRTALLLQYELQNF